MIEAYFGLRHIVDIIMLYALGVVIGAGLIWVVWALWKNRRKR